MSGAVLVLMAALVGAVVLSVLMWLFTRLSRRHKPLPFLEQLSVVTARTGTTIGPSSGVTNLEPMPPGSATSRASEQPDLEY